jgi:protein-disulfide isomerase
VEELMEELPGSVSLIYYHFPLASHRFAWGSAIAGACGAEAGRFPEITRQLFIQQDSIGVKPWTTIALEAGVTDTVSFLSCIQDSAARARVGADQAMGTDIEVILTPTVIINGWRFPLPPQVDSLNHYAHELVAGRSPFPHRR